MNVRIPKDQNHSISSADDLYPIMQKILLRENKFSRDQEHFWIVGLDQSTKILFIELIGLGRTNRVSTDAHTLFRMAIYKNALRVILVHNHPSGNLTPSDTDIDRTDYYYKSAKILNIEVSDHLIIDEKYYYSFADADEMENIKSSGKYEILTDEQKELMLLKNEHEKALKIALKLREMGLDDESIRKATGLRKVDLSEL